MTKDKLNDKIERYGAQEFHIGDAFLGASLALVLMMFWIMFWATPKATQDDIAILEDRIEWLQEENLDRIRDVGDVKNDVWSAEMDISNLKKEMRSYDAKLKAEANRDQFFKMIDKMLEQGRNADK